MTERRLRVVVPLPSYPAGRADAAEHGLTQNHLWMLREVEVLRQVCDVTVVNSRAAGFLDLWERYYDVMYLPCELCYQLAGLAARAGMPFLMRVFVPPPPPASLASDAIWTDILAMLRFSPGGAVVANTLPCWQRLNSAGVQRLCDSILPHVMPWNEKPPRAPLPLQYTYLGRLADKDVPDLIKAAALAKVPLRIAPVAAATEAETFIQFAAIASLAEDLGVSVGWVKATSAHEVDNVIDSALAIVSASRGDTFWMPGVEALSRGVDCRIVGNEYTTAAYGAWVNTGSWEGLAGWMAAGEVTAPVLCHQRLRAMGSDADSYLSRVVPLLEAAARAG